MPKTSLVLSCLALIFVLVAEITKASPEKRKFHVALVFDFSGKREPALDVVKGIEVAAAELNSSGKIEIILSRYNSGSDAIGTKEATLKASQSDADLIIAEIDSSKAAVAAEILESKQRVMITPYATSPVITKDRKYIFRTCFDDNFQGKQLAKFASKNLKAKTASIFFDGGSLYSQTLAESFLESFKASGGQVIRSEKISSASPSFKEQLSLASNDKADLVFIPIYEQAAARFISEGSSIPKARFTFLGGDGWGATQPFKDIVFRDFNHISGYWVSHYSGDFSKSNIKDVTLKFEKMFSTSLNASSAIGYDTLIIASKAFMASPNSKSQSVLAENLRKLPPYKGLSGDIQFEGKQSPRKSLFIRKIDRNKMGYVTELRP